MTENEIDSAIAAKFSDYAARTRLPEDFGRRLSVAVGRKRTRRRTGLLCAAGLVLASVAGIIFICANEPRTDAGKPSIVASNDAKHNGKTPYWVFLGYLQQCFKLAKPMRREEEISENNNRKE